MYGDNEGNYRAKLEQTFEMIFFFIFSFSMLKYIKRIVILSSINAMYFSFCQ